MTKSGRLRSHRLRARISGDQFPRGIASETIISRLIGRRYSQWQETAISENANASGQPAAAAGLVNVLSKTRTGQPGLASSMKAAASSQPGRGRCLASSSLPDCEIDVLTQAGV